jgi:hypothetical protein
MADDEPKQRQNEEGVFWTKATFKEVYGDAYKAKWKAAGKRSAEGGAAEDVRMEGTPVAGTPAPKRQKTDGATEEDGAAETPADDADKKQERTIVDGKPTFQCYVCKGLRFTSVQKGGCQKPCKVIEGHHGTYDAEATKRQEKKDAQAKERKQLKEAAKPVTRQATGASSSQAVQQQIAVVDVVQTRKTIDDIIRLLMKLKGHLVEFNLGVPVEETD